MSWSRSPNRRCSLAAWVWVALVAAPMSGRAADAAPAPTPAPAPAPVAIGEVLPGVSMAGLNGPDRRLDAYRGKRLIINVWASWCGPCRAEAASLERFAWSEAGARYTVIGVSTDDHRHLAAAWLKQSNATLSHFLDRELQLEHLLGASRIPLTVLVGPDGRVLARVQGAREWDSSEMRQLIDQAFGAAGRSRLR